MLALQDVEYFITAEVRVTPLSNRSEDTLSKYLDEIERRARSGKCYHRPSLGVREFAADFDWEADAETALARRATELNQPAGQFNEYLGLMLYDVFDRREREAGFRWLRDEESPALQPVVARHGRSARPKEAPRWTGKLVKPQPAFFHARIERSKLDCHPDRVQILTPTT